LDKSKSPDLRVQESRSSAVKITEVWRLPKRSLVTSDASGLTIAPVKASKVFKIKKLPEFSGSFFILYHYENAMVFG